MRSIRINLFFLFSECATAKRVYPHLISIVNWPYSGAKINFFVLLILNNSFGFTFFLLLSVFTHIRTWCDVRSIRINLFFLFSECATAPRSAFTPIDFYTYTHKAWDLICFCFFLLYSGYENANLRFFPVVTCFFIYLKYLKNPWI